MKGSFKNKIIEYFERSSTIKVNFARQHWKEIEAASKAIATCLKRGNKLLLFGNGGSAGDAQHISAEFVNRFRIERPPLPAIALTTDTSIITSIGNDYNFEDIFAKQIKAFGKKGDIAIGITTSGNSKNIVNGLMEANKKGITTIGFLGKDGGQAKRFCDIKIIVPCEETSFIQESHITIGHIICLLVDDILYPSAKK